MKEIPNEYKQTFKEIQTIRDIGDLPKALEKAKKFVKKYPDYCSSNLILGSIYWDLDDLDNAIVYFGQAVKLNPNKEKVSLCLFHTLWDKGRRFEALEEMKRFLTNNKSDEYTEILNGITAKLHERPIDTDL